MSLLSTWLRRRTTKTDLDAIVVMAGARGSCKSGSAISFSYDIDRTREGKSRFSMATPEGFELKEGEVMPRVVFTPTAFLNMISNDKLPKGSCIVFDEIGVAGDAREFMSKKNRMLKQVMETIRSRNLIIFLTAPTLASFDTSFRRSMSLYIRCLGQATKARGYPCALVIPRIAQTDPKSGEIYLKNMNFVIDHRKHALRKMYVRKPPAFLELPYKRYKLLMQEKLYSTYAKGMVAVDTYDLPLNKKDNPLSIDDLLKKVMANKENYLNPDGLKFSKVALQETLKITEFKARNLLQSLNYQIAKGTITI